MTKTELIEKTNNIYDKTAMGVQVLRNALNKGQYDKVTKHEEVKWLFEHYEVKNDG